LNDPEAFLGFGGPRPLELPSIARVTETPAEEAERRAQAGDFAKGIGLGLTTDIVGLAGDLPALLLSDAPKFAAALVMGKSFDEMPSTVLDEGLNAIRDTIGSDALAGYLGVDADTLAKPGVTTGRLLSSIVDPVVIGGAIKGLLKTKAGRAAKQEEATRNQRQALVRLADAMTADNEGIGALIPPAIAEDVDAGALAAIMPDELPTVDEVIGNHAYEVDEFNNPLQRQQFGALTEDDLLRQATSRQADIDGARQRLNEALADPDVTEEGRIIAEGEVISHENYLRQIQNELIGRRDGHITQLTQDEVDALPMPEEFEPPAQLMDQIGEMLDQQAIDQDIEDEISAFRTKMDELEPLDVTDTDGNPIPEGTFAGQPGGIGALDESAPVYGLRGVRIGASPDQFLGTVDHTSPTMANFYNFMGHNNGKTYARIAAKDGTMTGDQWLSALRQNAANRQNVKAVGPEIKLSEFERILTENKDRRFSAEEVRRLLTTRLPQTRSRLYLESNIAQEQADGTFPFYGDEIPHMTTQYRQEDLDSAIDKGVLVFSNTAPTIDVPGFGRQKPKVPHNYYGNHPNYYGHVRFIIVEGVDGKRYLQLNEIQSNAVSNFSSGYKSGKTINDKGEEVNFYRKTLEDRLNGFAGRGEGTGGVPHEDIRIPYTPEVHKLMQQFEDLKPEALFIESRLNKELGTAEGELLNLQNRIDTRFMPEIRNAEVTTPLIKFANVMQRFADDSSVIANILVEAENLRGTNGFGDPFRNARQVVEQNIADYTDMSGIPISPDQIAQFVGIVEKANDTLGRIRQAPDPSSSIHSGLLSKTLRNQLPVPEGMTYKQVMANMSDQELLPLLIKDRLLQDVNSIDFNKRNELISVHPKFEKGFDELTPDEIDFLSSIRSEEDRRPIVDKFLSRFTKDEMDQVKNDLAAFWTQNVANIDNVDESFYLSPNQNAELIVRQGIDNMLSTNFNGLLNRSKIRNITKKISELRSQKDANAPAAQQAKVDFDEAIANHPDGQKMLTLQDVAEKTETSNGSKGFQAPLPYDNEDDFTRFAVRSIMQQAEKLGLNGVIFPDANYLATQPQRMGGRPEQIVASDPFIKRYGKIVDEELKELSKANQNAGVRVYDEEYDILPEYRRERAFTVNAIDRNNVTNLEILQPLEEAEAAAKKAKKEAYARLSDSQKQQYVIRQNLPDANDVDFFENIPDDDAYYLQPYVAASEALNLAESQLRQAKRSLVQEYRSPIRVVEFGGPNDGLQAEANRQVVRRPIRRAAGGMVRSGIGAMAREVL